MEMRTLGNTDLRVSRLGIGLSEIGALALIDEAQAARILNTALDSGITFLDTAACYDNSEALLGRTVAGRRDEYILATKCGHLIDNEDGEPWTAQTIRRSIERSLKRLNTDHVDLLQLHSCGVDVLEQGEVIEAVLEAKRQGKTRYVGYSGDNEAALWAVESGHFDTLQTSFNLVDQRARERLLPLARERGLGVIVKRPIANGSWGAAASPSSYADAYFERAQTLRQDGPVPGAPDNRILLALGFTLAHDEVDTTIVGSRNPDHIRDNIAWLEKLPLESEAVEELHRRFERVGSTWEQLS